MLFRSVRAPHSGPFHELLSAQSVGEESVPEVLMALRWLPCQQPFASRIYAAAAQANMLRTFINDDAHSPPGSDGPLLGKRVMLPALEPQALE